MAIHAAASPPPTQPRGMRFPLVAFASGSKQKIYLTCWEGGRWGDILTAWCHGAAVKIIWIFHLTFFSPLHVTLFSQTLSVRAWLRAAAQKGLFKSKVWAPSAFAFCDRQPESSLHTSTKAPPSSAATLSGKSAVHYQMVFKEARYLLFPLYLPCHLLGLPASRPTGRPPGQNPSSAAGWVSVCVLSFRAILIMPPQLYLDGRVW